MMDTSSKSLAFLVQIVVTSWYYAKGVMGQPEPEKQPQEQHACPECGKGHLVERKTRFGKTFYACDNYPKCKFAVNLPPVKGRCEECGFTLLVEKKLASGVKLQCANRKCQHTQQG
jgi:putative DNA topoisomerase